MKLWMNFKCRRFDFALHNWPGLDYNFSGTTCQCEEGLHKWHIYDIIWYICKSYPGWVSRSIVSGKCIFYIWCITIVLASSSSSSLSLLLSKTSSEPSNLMYKIQKCLNKAAPSQSKTLVPTRFLFRFRFLPVDMEKTRKTKQSSTKSNNPK